MAVVRKVSTPNSKLPDDPGLTKLSNFIKRSLKEPDDKKRMLLADKDYSFTVQSEFPLGRVERQVVQVPAGQPLYFHRRDGSDTTNDDLFMVNEGGHGWQINTATGAVRYFNNPIHVSAAPQIFDSRAKGSGSKPM